MKEMKKRNEEGLNT